MAFSTIIVGTLIIYCAYYAVNIIYDLFVAGANQPSATEDEEIEITEDDCSLQTTSYSTSTFDHLEQSEEPLNELKEEEDAPVVNENVADMNGALTIDELCDKVKEATFPSELDILAQTWIAH